MQQENFSVQSNFRSSYLKGRNAEGWTESEACRLLGWLAFNGLNNNSDTHEREHRSASTRAGVCGGCDSIDGIGGGGDGGDGWRWLAVVMAAVLGIT